MPLPEGRGGGAEVALARLRGRRTLSSRYWTGGLRRCSSEDNGRVTSLAVPAAVLSRARRVADGFRALTGSAVDADVLLGGRAALLGLSPRGRISGAEPPDSWPAETGGAASRSRDVTTSRPFPRWSRPTLWTTTLRRRWSAGSGRTTAPMSSSGGGCSAYRSPPSRETPAESPKVYPLSRHGVARTVRAAGRRFFGDVGGPAVRTVVGTGSATVVKVESIARPDGARSGPPACFDWMNGGKLRTSPISTTRRFARVARRCGRGDRVVASGGVERRA